MELEQFKIWLKTTKKLGERSSKDVISRYKRASSFLGYEPYSDMDVEKLDNCPDFSLCSVNVKSQMRRAIRLFILYKGETK